MAKNQTTAVLHLDKQRGRSLSRRHPWLFSGAIERIDGNPGPGDTVDMVSSNGKFLARGAYSPKSQIRARVWTFDADERIDEDFLARRVQRAVDMRHAAGIAAAADTYRVVFSEADGLPGLIADRYGDTLVVQILSAGAERFRDALADQLMKSTGCSRVYERSDTDAREREGLAPRTGSLRGGEPPARIEVMENGLRFAVDVRSGHKTGFYADQRDNRALARGLCRDAVVLDCFCYTGGFTASALAGGAASVCAVDASQSAIALARDNADINDLPLSDCEFLCADVFETLRRFEAQGQQFDMIILDPPKLAVSRTDLDRAGRAYKDANMLGLRLLRPGGLLLTFSCSGAVDPATFQKFVSWAALDAGARPVLLRRLGQPADHPVTLEFPEGEYLCGLLLRKDLE